MKELTLPRPTEKQKLFLEDAHRYLAFGGSRGGGKSFAVRMDAIIKCMKYPGIKIIIVRRTYPELVANHIQPMTEWLRCYSPEGFATYNDARKEIRFPKGSNTGLHRLCQNVEIPMTMHWLKTSSPSSKRNVFTDRKLQLLRKLGTSLTTISSAITIIAFSSKQN